MLRAALFLISNSISILILDFGSTLSGLGLFCSSPSVCGAICRSAGSIFPADAKSIHELDLIKTLGAKIESIVAGKKCFSPSSSP